MKGSGKGAQVLGRAEEFLRRSDPVMARLVSLHGRCALSRMEFRPFHALAVTVIGQQLSSKAAETIANRVAGAAGFPFRPERILAVPPEALRSAGVSWKKVSCLRSLSERVLSGGLSLGGLGGESNAEVVRSLTAVSGIGRWTAEMFLIFGLGRLDVFSESDAGLRRAIKNLYHQPGQEDPDPLELSEKWRPFRSVASWYLWKHLDGPAGGAEGDA